VLLLLVLSIFGAPAWAVPVELQFTNADLNLGDNSVIVLAGNEYAAFGIGVEEAYRYIDARDPFSDAPNDVGVPCANAVPPDGRCSFGLSNNNEESSARINFLTPTPVSFDWWVLGHDAEYVVLDPNGAPLTSFLATAGQSGTVDVLGLVGSITWSNNFVGFSNIANIRYEVEEDRVPEPGSLLLLGLSVFVLGVRSRRRS
jgi:hypothetical protein